MVELAKKRLFLVKSVITQTCSSKIEYCVLTAVGRRAERQRYLKQMYVMNSWPHERIITHKTAKGKMTYIITLPWRLSTQHLICSFLACIVALWLTRSYCCMYVVCCSVQGRFGIRFENKTCVYVPKKKRPQENKKTVRDRSRKQSFRVGN